MLRFETAGTPGNFVSIDPQQVTAVTEGLWPSQGKSFLSGNNQEKPVATIWLPGDSNWTVLDPNRTVAKQIETAKKGTQLS